MGPELKTEFRVSDDIRLRMFREGDAVGVFHTVVRNLEHLKPFMHWATPEYSVESAREFIEISLSSAEARRGFSFGLFDRGEFIGSVGFVKFDWTVRKTEIGYWIDKEEEGKGIVSAACRVLIEYAFDELGMNRVEVRCSSKNERSAAIPERFGFKMEGVLRQSEFRDGRLHDFFIFGLLADEWRSNRLID